MANKLFFIVEGERTEDQILKNMDITILKETNSISVYSFGNNIYELYERIHRSEGLNIIEILNEIKDGLKIFLTQKEKYIDTSNKVMILNSFPIFVCNYVKKTYYEKLISS